MSDNILSDNLVDLMKKGKVTIGELSDATGIAEITINKLRNKQNINPTLSTLVQISNYFGITINDLLGNNKRSMPILNEDGTEITEKLPIDKMNSDAEFAIKITHNNYPDFQKNTILLVNSQIKVKNGDYIIIQSNNNFIACRAIIEPDGILAESLSRKENIYKIELNSLLGVVVGGLWLRS